jgi:hypothetical protein
VLLGVVAVFCVRSVKDGLGFDLGWHLQLTNRLVSVPKEGFTSLVIVGAMSVVAVVVSGQLAFWLPASFV